MVTKYHGLSVYFLSSVCKLCKSIKPNKTNFKREVDMKNEPENLKNLTVTSSGTSVVQSAAGRAMQNRKSAADSTLNSLECWDYSVELECLRGPDGKFFI